MKQFHWLKLVTPYLDFHGKCSLRGNWPLVVKTRWPWPCFVVHVESRASIFSLYEMDVTFKVAYETRNAGPCGDHHTITDIAIYLLWRHLEYGFEIVWWIEIQLLPIQPTAFNFIKKVDCDTDAFFWVFQNISEQLHCRNPMGQCCCLPWNGHFSFRCSLLLVY